MFRIEETKGDCCRQIFDGEEYIGTWCSKSHKVVVDGKLLGWASDEKGVLTRLKLVSTPIWMLVDEEDEV